MKKIKLITLFFLITASTYGQIKIKQFNKENFSINYPDNWRLDTSGRMNTTFILFSETLEKDLFNENINMTIQDLTNQGFTMDSYVKLSENQIESMVVDGQIIESIYNKEKKFHTLVWSGKVTGRVLKFKQYFFLKNEKIYLITLTTLPSTYDEYLEEGNKILNTFKLKL